MSLRLPRGVCLILLTAAMAGAFATTTAEDCCLNVLPGIGSPYCYSVDASLAPADGGGGGTPTVNMSMQHASDVVDSGPLWDVTQTGSSTDTITGTYSSDGVTSQFDVNGLRSVAEEICDFGDRIRWDKTVTLHSPDDPATPYTMTNSAGTYYYEGADKCPLEHGLVTTFWAEWQNAYPSISASDVRSSCDDLGLGDERNYCSIMTYQPLVPWPGVPCPIGSCN